MLKYTLETFADLFYLICLSVCLDWNEMKQSDKVQDRY